jgi:hypothetical protein
VAFPVGEYSTLRAGIFKASIRNEYEISTDVKSFFEEQDPALDRLARDFAQRLVAAITENF